MIPFDDPELRPLIRVLEKYDLGFTLNRLAGLLTVPSLHANNDRLEVLVHLAVIHCKGRRKPDVNTVSEWLNGYLGDTALIWLEDPTEDVFVANVVSPLGNHRLFQGRWPASSFFAQAVIDILCNRQSPRDYQNLLDIVMALLILSDFVAERTGLQRWHAESSTPGNRDRLAPAVGIADRGRAVSFTESDFRFLNIDPDFLEPFIIESNAKSLLKHETLGHTSLERYPLVRDGSRLILALPNAVGPAIRRFVLSELREVGLLSRFTEMLTSYQSYQIESEGFSNLSYTDFPNSPDLDTSELPINDWLIKVDVNKCLHLVHVHSCLGSLCNERLDSLNKMSDETEELLSGYLDETVRHCLSSPGVSDGITLMILGGLGGNHNLRNNEWNGRWRFSVIHISDFLMLTNEPDYSISKYLKYIKQKRMVEESGVMFTDLISDYAHLCFWLRSNFQIIPQESSASPNNIICIDDSFAQQTRIINQRLIDKHVTQTTNGYFVTVMRHDVNPYFKSLSNRPIYHSIDHIQSGLLAGVIETRRGPRWLNVKPLKVRNEQLRGVIYEFWNNFLDLYYRLLMEIESSDLDILSGPLEVSFDISDVVMPDVGMPPNIQAKLTKPDISVEGCSATIKFPSELLWYFHGPDNIGERYVVKNISKALMEIYSNSTEEGGNRQVDKLADDLTDVVVGNVAIRVIHVFESHDPVEQLLMRHRKSPILLAHEDFMFAKINLAEGCIPNRGNSDIESRIRCHGFLNEVVVKIRKQICCKLNTLDRKSVILNALSVHERIIQDRDRWSRTANAVLSLFGSDDVHATVQEHEGLRSVTGLAARTILEMALCECPSFGGIAPSQEQLDEIIARVALMNEVAAHSDGIAKELIDPPINLHPNGSYSIDQKFLKTVIEPFLKSQVIDDFEKDAAKYSDLYKNKNATEPKVVGELYSTEFIDAFHAEFGMHLQDFFEGFWEVFELALDCDKTVVDTTLGELKGRLRANRDFSSDTIDSFINALSLFPRPEWVKPPPGFCNRDISPRRYSRRLSIVFKPLLLFGNKDTDRVVFGVGTFKQGILHLLGCLEEGYLPEEFFHSREMKKYRGWVADLKGHAFTKLVANHMRQYGWNALEEVPMTQFGAQDGLGDVDVLAWKSSGEVQIVECKRLRLSRKVSEIAEICRKFRGEAKDELFKHLRRVNWIKDNPSCLNSFTRLNIKTSKIDHRLVTNVQVPMSFLTDLPIESANIGPLDQL